MSSSTGSKSGRIATIEIDGSALRHNLAQVKKLSPNRRVMAVIKANAYGHGVLTATKYLSEADAFALATTHEAVLLRDEGVEKPLIVLQGFSDTKELDLLASKNIQPVLHQNWQVDLVEKYSGHALKVWLKIDTGMHRLGLAPEDFRNAYDRLLSCSVVTQISVMSHFANADQPDHALNTKQINAFNHATSGLNVERSLANSAGVIAFPESHMDWVRPGIMLYGSSPLLNRDADEFNLEPAMNFSSRLIAVHHLKKGDAIGYGSTWACPENMCVGVVAAGYGDGYSRHAESATPVMVNSVVCPLIGRVSMDSLCIDLRGVDARAGDPVVLWGKGLSIDAVARGANTIAYELMCHAGNTAGLV